MKKNSKKKILCFVEYFIPGYRAGGPIKSVYNLISSLSDKFEFKVITRDYDYGEKRSYHNINSDNWNKVKSIDVFYISKQNTNLKSVYKLLKSIEYDLIYFNSFFSKYFTIVPLFLIKSGFIKERPLIMAPRGEFSPEALKLKNLKKTTYIQIYNFFSFYKNTTWQASTITEKKDIIKNLPDTKKKIFIAPDLLSFDYLNTKRKKIIRKSGPLRLIFLSRISPMKNLKFVLRLLIKVKTKVIFDIYGPKSDISYWNECLQLIDKLPNNIKLKIHHEISNNQVQKIFQRYDLFLFPTLGENFGHVIFESLSASTPILISDKSPWKDYGKGGLHIIPLDEKKWIKTITKWSKFDNKTLQLKRDESYKYLINFTNQNNAIIKNKKLFNAAMDL